ncbi:unnamed protein product [Prunus armeniaca]
MACGCLGHANVLSTTLLSSHCLLAPLELSVGAFIHPSLFALWSKGGENCVEPNCTHARVSLEVYTEVYVECEGK